MKPIRQRITYLLLFGLLAGVVGLVEAQSEPVSPPAPQNLIDEKLRLDGNIAYCLNKSSALVEFDRAVGQLLADVLLVGTSFHELFSVFPTTRPYEFKILLEEAELYLGIINNCDALLGVRLEQHSVPDWLTVTRPYYTSRMVIAVTDPNISKLDDLPRASDIGSRIAGVGDYQLRAYIESHPEHEWRRLGYPDNAYLIERLLDGTLAAVLIWEPAVYLATDGNPEAHGIAVFAPPFPTVPLEFGLALPSNAAFLQHNFDAAIDELHMHGQLSKLAEEYGLP